jgi:predicted CXXCH cytochrome family protein
MVLRNATLVALCASALLAACRGSTMSPRRLPTATATSIRSNVTRADYAGSAACAPCHADVVAAWERSPMHRMTRNATGAEIRAPFDSSRWRFKDDAVVLERRGEDRFVRVESGSAGAKTYRVTRVIGGRTREDFAGVELGGSDEEVVLPISFMLATSSLRYKGYSVMVHERSGLRAGPVWSRACIFCHNTIPEIDRLLGAVAGPGARPYQGEQVEHWLTEERRARVRVLDEGAFASALSDESSRLGGGAGIAGGGVGHEARKAIDVVRSGFDGRALVEVGIGCEACHGGAREHVQHPAVHPSFSPVAPWLDFAYSTRSPAEAVNRACARCHQVLFSRYPFTWEGGRRDAGAGGSHINSGEARDFLLGGCSRTMACTACHDPHGPDAPDRLAALARPAGNATCTRCHTELRDEGALRRHAHHDPSGAGGSCIACHMPRKNMGLDGQLTRYHRIGSPTDAARVLGDRPLECALCHVDRSAGSLVDAMEQWWPVRYPRQRIEELYGSLDANTIRATLERGKPHEQAVAIALLGEARAVDAAPLVGRQLLSEYPLVREWAKRALVSMLGTCDVNLAADDATIATEAAKCAGPAAVAAHVAPAPPAPRDEDPED